MPAAELVYRLLELAFALLVLFVRLEVVRVVEKLGVLGKSGLIFHPFAQVIAGAAIAPGGARAFTICPFRIALGHLSKLPLRGRLRGPGPNVDIIVLRPPTGGSGAGALSPGTVSMQKASETVPRAPGLRR